MRGKFPRNRLYHTVTVLTPFCRARNPSQSGERLTPSESPLCIPNIKSSSSVTEKLLLNDKYQVQSVANAYMRAVKRINLCWGYLSWSYFSWLFHLTDYSWTLLTRPWSVTVYRVIAGRLQGSSKSFVVWIRTEWFLQLENFAKDVKNAKHFETCQCDTQLWRWWPLNRQGQYSRYPFLIHQAVCSLSSGFFSVKEMLSTGSKAKCHLQEGSMPTYGAD